MATSHGRHKFKSIDNTGFGPNSSVEGGRLVNRDGSTNLKKRGIPFWQRISIYHSLLRMKRSHFLLMILFFYTCINLFFAIIYFAIGVHHLMGVDENVSLPYQFMEAFFFSSQTLTTVGYGHVAPSGMITNCVASAESLIGILVFALVTGLMYGRFSRPRAYLIFSDNMLIAPYKEGRAIMFRISSYKNNHLTDVEANVTIALHIKEHEKTVTKFYPLPLEFSKINSLALSWTIVHHINEDSPLYNMTEAEMIDSKIELIAAVKAFDDHFSNIVQQRTSYTFHQLIYGAKFLPMFERAVNGQSTILELNKINAHEMVNIEERLVNSNTHTLAEKS